MAKRFAPFADDTASFSIGGLTVENGVDRVSLSGSLDLARDRQGLDRARALRSTLDAIVSALEADGALPDEAARPLRARVSKVPNPFA